jgi:hypothetical protein
MFLSASDFSQNKNGLQEERRHWAIASGAHFPLLAADSRLPNAIGYHF